MTTGQPDLTENERRVLEVKVAASFRPAAPISQADLFAGRADEIRKILDVAMIPGQHAIIYGERGVGKSSLANILPEWIARAGLSNVVAAKVSCDSTDDYESIWRKLFQEIEFSAPVRQLGFLAGTELKKFSLAATQGEGEPITPNLIRRVLRELSYNFILIIDEFDVLTSPRSKHLFAETIKTLSDYSVPATLVLVGVGTTIDDLLVEHASVDRALVQIPLPRMDFEDLEEIIDKGSVSAGMPVERHVREMIARLSHGLPHYTHLLGLYSFRAALDDLRRNVTDEDFWTAVGVAARGMQESVSQNYTAAVHSNYPGSMFEEVLLACALCPMDLTGAFAPNHVKIALAVIKRRDSYTIAHFTRHLEEFSSQKRRNILRKVGSPRRYRYQFTDSLMQPFVVIHGLAKGLITEDNLEEVMEAYERSGVVFSDGG